MSSMSVLDAPSNNHFHTALESFARYQRSRSLDDLDESVRYLQLALELVPDDDDLKALYLTNLGNSFSARFIAKGDISDLSASIAAGTTATELIPDTSPEKPAILANLGTALRQRFNRLGHISDADSAVDKYKRALQLMHDDDAHRSLLLLNYGLTLRTRFEVTGHSEDIEEAITAIRQAVPLVPQESIHYPVCLNNLGLCLMRLFERSLDPKDIDEAIEACRLSVQSTPDDDIRKAARWHTLASTLDTRSAWLDLSDADELNAAVFAAEQAVYALPDGHIQKPICLNMLSLALRRRLNFESAPGRNDMNNMINAAQKAVELCPDDSSQKAMLLDTLGTALLEVYRARHDMTLLDAAVYAAQSACESSLTTDSHLGWRLYHLAIALSERFSVSKQRADIALAINVAKLAVNAILPEDGYRGQSFYLLAHLLQRSHDVLGDSLDLNTRILALQVTAASPGPPGLRFESARSLAAALLESRGPDAAFPAWKLAVELIPKLIWLGRGLQDRVNLSRLELVAKVLPDAIESILLSDDGAILGYAVEWLEENRCIIWGQYDDFRAPLDLIRASDVRLAEEIESISKRLASFDTAWSANPAKFGDDGLAARLARRTLAQRFEQLVEEARKLPRCVGFLQQKSLADLQAAGAHTPIVMLTQLDTYCRVVLELPPGNRFIPFKVMFTLRLAERVRDAVSHSIGTASGREESITRASFAGRIGAEQRQDDFEKALRVLWLQLVRPILDTMRSLKILIPGPLDELPRLTWSPTGILSFLPLHAAGIYSGDALEVVYDRVISSYTPNLTVLLNAERRRTSSTDIPTIPTILGIAQPETPGQPALPATRVEVQKLAAMVPTSTCLVGEDATRNAVLEQMKHHAWVHLACHGIQNPRNFLDSAFMLHDGPLRLKDIMVQSFQHTQLAFLSACQTATGDRRFPGENLHLAAGLLHAGFGSVCATMWSIQDEDGPMVSEQFYASLLGDGGDCRRSAHALHRAVAHLREHVGAKEFSRWVPFIHLGI